MDRIQSPVISSAEFVLFMYLLLVKFIRAFDFITRP